MTNTTAAKPATQLPLPNKHMLACSSFLSLYDVMRIPERFISEPGDPDAQTKTDNFFKLVLDDLGYDEQQRSAFCKIRTREIATESENNNSSPHLTDDRITELLAKDRTIAVAIKIRNDWNFTQVMLASFLTPEFIAEL